jgi:hypothetical protein
MSLIVLCAPEAKMLKPVFASTKAPRYLAALLLFGDLFRRWYWMCSQDRHIQLGHVDVEREREACLLQ